MVVKYKDLRLILMSAIIDSQLFVDYMSAVQDKTGPLQLFQIEGRMFDVTEYANRYMAVQYCVCVCYIYNILITGPTLTLYLSEFFDLAL